MVRQFFYQLCTASGEKWTACAIRRLITFSFAFIFNLIIKNWMHKALPLIERSGFHFYLLDERTLDWRNTAWIALIHLNYIHHVRLIFLFLFITLLNKHLLRSDNPRYLHLRVEITLLVEFICITIIFHSFQQETDLWWIQSTTSGGGKFF